jgi:hypothetical protein
MWNFKQHYPSVLATFRILLNHIIGLPNKHRSPLIGLVLQINKTGYSQFQGICICLKCGRWDAEGFWAYFEKVVKNVFNHLIGSSARCLIHNAHLGKILSFLQNFRPKNNTLKGIVWLLFSFISTIVFLAWPIKVKTVILYHKTVCIR